MNHPSYVYLNVYIYYVHVTRNNDIIVSTETNN